MHATLRAHPNRRGARALGALLASEEAEFTVESEAERMCLRLMIKHGLKPDAAGAWIGPYRVDFLYEAERLVVEVDGYRYHRTRERFVRDRRRRADLQARGYEVFVITWADIADEPAVTMTRLRTVRNARRA
jgi:very-short-patch-repair endonuclease